ncbi:hypothetical protein conserved [Entamoeba histolytica]|uniref:Uncharacterized protein n=1 Tax=Entamoeba histolytica TaxID=5759 RepID=A0A175JPT3_ENTHI|nr:hypothetical protein conserved [Entamoeba histolytica]
MHGIDYSYDSGQEVSESLEETIDSHSVDIENELEKLNNFMLERIECQKGIEEWRNACDHLSSCFERGAMIEAQEEFNSIILSDIDPEVFSKCVDFMKMWTTQEFNENAMYGLRMLCGALSSKALQSVDVKTELINWICQKADSFEKKAFCYAMIIFGIIVIRDDMLDNCTEFRERVLLTFIHTNGFTIDNQGNISNNIDALAQNGTFEDKEINLFDSSTDVKCSEISNELWELLELKGCYCSMKRFPNDVINSVGTPFIQFNNNIKNKINKVTSGIIVTRDDIKWEKNEELMNEEYVLQQRIQMSFILYNDYLYSEAMYFIGNIMSMAQDYCKELIQGFPSEINTINEQRLNGLLNMFTGIVYEHQIISLLHDYRAKAIKQFIINCVDSLTSLLVLRQKATLGVLKLLLSIPDNFDIIVDTNILKQVIIYASSKSEDKDIIIPCFSFVRDIIHAPIIKHFFTTLGYPNQPYQSVYVSSTGIRDLYSKLIYQTNGSIELFKHISVIQALVKSGLIKIFCRIINGININCGYYEAHCNGMIEILFDILQFASLVPEASQVIMNEPKQKKVEGVMEEELQSDEEIDELKDSNIEYTKEFNGPAMLKTFIEDVNISREIILSVTRTVFHCISNKEQNHQIIETLKKNGFVTGLMNLLECEFDDKLDVDIVYFSIQILLIMSKEDDGVMAILKPLKIGELCGKVLHKMSDNVSLESNNGIKLLINAAQRMIQFITNGNNIEKEHYFIKHINLLDRMVVEFDKKDALTLVYNHLLKEGLIKAAETLRQEAKLNLTNQKSIDTVTFDEVVKDYITHQHLQCKKCSTIIPEQKITQKHHCDNTHCKNNEISLNLAHRLMNRMCYGNNTMYANQYNMTLAYSSNSIKRFIIDSPEVDSQVSSLAIIDDGLIVGTNSGALKMFENDKTYYDWFAYNGDGIHSIDQLMVNEKRVYALNENGSLMTFLLTDLQQRDTTTNPINRIEGYGAFTISNNGDIICGASRTEKKLDLIDSATSELIETLIIPDIPITSPPVFSPCDSLLFSSRRLFDMRQKNPIYTFDFLTSYNGGMFTSDCLDVLIDSELWDLRMLKLKKTTDLLNGCYSRVIDDDIFVSFKYDETEEHQGHSLVFNTTFAAFNMDCKMISRTDVVDSCFEYSKVMGDGYISGIPDVSIKAKQVGVIVKKERANVLLFEYAQNKRNYYDNLESSDDELSSDDEMSSSAFEEEYENNNIFGNDYINSEDLGSDMEREIEYNREMDQSDDDFESSNDHLHEETDGEDINDDNIMSEDEGDDNYVYDGFICDDEEPEEEEESEMLSKSKEDE